MQSGVLSLRNSTPITSDKSIFEMVNAQENDWIIFIQPLLTKRSLWKTINANPDGI